MLRDYAGVVTPPCRNTPRAGLAELPDCAILFRMNTASFAALLILSSAMMPVASGAPPLIKAAVEEPVLPELMGGCSLRCAFRWEVEAAPGASGKAERVKSLNDESAETAWLFTPPASPKDARARLRLVFPKKLPAESDGQTPIYGLDLINGHWKSEELWQQHGRIRKARLFYNDKPLRDVSFADSRRWQRVELPDIMVRSGDFMTLEVLEIYAGQKPGVAISEIVLQGAH